MRREFKTEQSVYIEELEDLGMVVDVLEDMFIIRLDSFPRILKSSFRTIYGTAFVLSLPLMRHFCIASAQLQETGRELSVAR